MISLKARQICSITSTICRRYSKTTFKTDPGIRKRAAVINPMEIQEDMDLDDLESDFMNSHKSYKQHVKEVASKQEQLKYLIVKNKYFKEKYPNFLTWSDKEQIKFLHSSDPEEWTVEKLSESFPALPEVVKKVVKAKFSKSESKKKQHDAVVEQNWKDFKSGKFNLLPPDLVEHLKKFTTRKIQTPYINKKVEVVNVPKIQSEFSEIITSYQKLRNKQNEYKEKHEMNISKEINLNVDSKTHEKKTTDTFLTVDKKALKQKNLITLSQLQSSIEVKANEGIHLTEEEKLIFKDTKRTQEASITLHQEGVREITEKKFTASTGSSLSTKTDKDYSHLIYPESIIIPKGLRKRGYTYKLNDCYYDTDGEFLYRVPGME